MEVTVTMGQKEGTIMCKGCGTELTDVQVKMLGNPGYNEWCRKGYCTFQCWQKNAQKDNIPSQQNTEEAAEKEVHLVTGPPELSGVPSKEADTVQHVESVGSFDISDDDLKKVDVQRASADRWNDFASHCQRTFTDVVTESDNGLVKIGDLFLSTGGLVFVSYGQRHVTSKTAVGIGGFLGGAAGAVTMVSLRWKEHKDLRLMAAEEREKVFGLSLEKRIQKHGEIVLSRDEIQSVEYDSSTHMIRLTHANGGLALVVADAAITRDTINAWMTGELSDGEDPLGVNLHLPEIQGLLTNISICLEVDSEMSTDLARAAACKPYVETFLKLLFKLKKTERERAILKISTGPTAFKDAILSAVRELSRCKRKKKWILVGLAMAFAIVALTCVVDMVCSTGDVSDGVVILGLNGMIWLMVAIPFALVSIWESRKCKALFSMLTAHSVPYSKLNNGRPS